VPYRLADSSVLLHLLVHWTPVRTYFQARQEFSAVSGLELGEAGKWGQQQF
jgi:hypothetical protein